jgi:hypothetical protein
MESSKLLGAVLPAPPHHRNEGHCRWRHSTSKKNQAPSTT